MNQRDKKNNIQNNNSEIYNFQITNGLNVDHATNGFEQLTEKQILNVVCFSHLRWNFVYQRPQHLLSRWAQNVNVYYFEEPIFGKKDTISLEKTKNEDDVIVLTPHLKEGMSEPDVYRYLEILLIQFLRMNQIRNYISWYYTPMAIPFTQNIRPSLVVYDCMDELSGFKGAHPNLAKNEKALMQKANVVFTGGHHLYEFKKKHHDNMYPFPSSIDQDHFQSGKGAPDPADQKNIPHPRAGFFGVIDERLDINLLDGLATNMPDFHFVMIGPIIKIDPKTLPRHSNIHYLGQKEYKHLPLYLANWDVAILPFAKNESTEFISPTKTPEYLCAEKPVVSTSIRDVVVPYGEKKLVHIADTVDTFSKAIRLAFGQKDDEVWLKKVTDMLKTNSWDLTYAKMRKIIGKCLMQKDKIEENLFQLNIAQKVSSMGMMELKKLNDGTS